MEHAIAKMASKQTATTRDVSHLMAAAVQAAAAAVRLVRPAAVRLVRPAAVRPAAVRPAAVRLAAVRPAAVRLAVLNQHPLRPPHRLKHRHQRPR